jgi:O-antigen/teichoic acid export membrane protein
VDDDRPIHREVQPRMATTPLSSRSVRRSYPPAATPISPQPGKVPAPRRIASNFVALSVAEIVCRGTSIAVTLMLAKTLGAAGYGRIEFAFNVVFWLVLFVRDGIEVIATRELARHPRLVRPLANHVLAARGVFALALYVGLVAVSACTLSSAADRAVMSVYGLLLITTALGLDYVFRGRERMAVVAVSLCVRTLIYAVGVWFCVTKASQIVLVPAWLAFGEACGIGLVWACYSRKYGLPRPVLGMRFLRVFFRRGRSVCLIHVSQTVIGSADLLVVGVMSQWSDVGRYGAPHRMVMAILTFGLIFQQVVFPTLARSWRQTPGAGREALDALVKILVLSLLPLAIGGALLSDSLVAFLLPAEYRGAGLLLALGIWRAPLLILAYLYQTTLIAVNRESTGVRLLLAGATGSGPLVALFCWLFGLAGALVAVLIVALGLLLAGYACLAREGRQPAWHHHLAKPLIASAVMVPVCLTLLHTHVLAAVAGGALVYVGTLIAIGGVPREALRSILSRGRAQA